MNSLKECVNQYIKEGYNRNYAISKVCQDIIVNRIYHSTYSDKITIKGGVVMFHLTNNIRRATQDLDIDFIKYSLSDVSIDLFIDELNNIQGIRFIRSGEIEELNQQDYHGKRVFI